METSKRKLDHIKICLEEEVETGYTGLEDVMLIHKALPEVNFDEIDTRKRFFHKELNFPFFIASMTGGHPNTKEINKNLAIAVEEEGIGMGVGSQRAAIEDKSLEESFTVVREFAPKAFIYANIGIPQLLERGVEVVDRAIEMIDADAVAIHLNFLQECIQPEGSLKAKGGIEVIEEVCNSVSVPVIVKETGGGISREVALKLKEIGVDAIDVGGKGGTTFSGVETFRVKDETLRDLGRDFWEWGIPTAFSIVDCHGILPIIATGGIRSGLDVAKCLAIGAEVASSALPFLKAAVNGSEEVRKKIKYFERGLKTTMFLTGCKKVSELKRVRIFVNGSFRRWLEFRNFNIEKFMFKR
ncbi:type 2 isopentenyl-diphosphate Delta-isomerase [Archaeoglobales archaeon]|nr:MAG: type 2 isopentenyl-diphosphate Delta-isomerase [Archaeoglobales archaeon]